MQRQCLSSRVLSLMASLLFATAATVQSPCHAQGCSADINGDGRVDGADLATVLSQWGNCPPSVTAVTPAQGSVLGGTVITITGTGLAATTAVTVGGAPCTNLVVLTPTQIRATTPAGVAGQAPIAVTTPSGTSLSPTPFTYVMQSVTSIVPSSGPYTGGTAITISGQYLAGTTSVTIGGVPATNVVVVNSTTVTAVTPAGSVGTVDVVVTGSKGAVTVPGGFTYQSFIVPAWATLLEAMPDPAIVTSSTLRDAILATGYAWRVRDNGTNIEMVLIPPGTFNMGCSASNSWGCASDESPVHSVTLTNAFYLGRYEVTQAQWIARMGSNPSYFVARPENGNTANTNRPVETVSWDQIAGTGGFLSGTGLRLPTEAEWEYAYRAGTTTAFHGFTGYLNGTNDDNLVGNIAWFRDNNDGSGSTTYGTKAVGQKLANGFGLHDMAGNVYEWVNDWHGSTYYSSSPLTNPPGPASSTSRVMRGGYWGDSTEAVRSSHRNNNSPNGASGGIGFRVARAPL